ncbi:HAD-IC family P-type ATPase [Sphingomonas sp. CFBP 13603]|uniref:cation-translocating P-type ATPase n=1 Tax=Sphingomonas sp. CFBP 13603 TaxID=2774040 RepID=UPI0018660C4D|nr:HAD-IC family P-type ATPase [Sphingomonas sp. CFBP 13603]MBE2991942.1 HAD-IC family P-type ATPase [Sphingomonas sp. CFBP 13603]
MIVDRPIDAPVPSATIWHATSTDHVMAVLGTRDAGLTAAEAAGRLIRDGVNELPPPPVPSTLLLFLRQFNSPLIYLLVAAAAISLSLGHRTDAGFIGVVLLVNAAIGTFQESKAADSLAALGRMIGQTAMVRRGGMVSVIDARALVVGDVVELESGMAVPADIRLSSSSALRVDQSTFSGESVAVAKDQAVVLPIRTAPGERATMVLAGTMIEQGRGVGIVVATGANTALGAIDESLRATKPTPPPLVIRLDRLARQISIATIALIVPFALVLWVQGRPGDQILLLAVALAVSAIPEGLSIAVTVALAAGTRRMAARNVIVRSLPAVEGLGACTIIASDKTGTLTRNILSVERILLADGRTFVRADWADDGLAAMRRAAALCNEASVGPDGMPVGDSVDVALLGFARDGGEDLTVLHAVPRIAALPYEPERKFSTVAVAEGSGARVFAKGAPEVVRRMCHAIDPVALEAATAMAEDGYRVIAVAASGGVTTTDPDAPTGLVLLGWIGLIDPVRPEVPAAIARCAEAGIGVRMVTGDHPGTALTIARGLGLEVATDQVVTGTEMANLADQPGRLAGLVLGGRVFARIEPVQKLEIVRILAASGELVAVTGDGVNDAPALQAAHIGVAMGIAGTDVARGAADLVLADDNFASIVAGVEEGRVTYANVRRIVIILLATGIAEIGMFIGAVMLGLPMPLTAVQLLWLNLVTNGAQDVMLGFGRGEGDELRQPPRPPSAPILDRSAIALMIPPALLMTGLALYLVSGMHRDGRPLAEIQNAVLLMTVLFQNAYVLCMRSERRSILREPLLSNAWLLVGVGIAIALQVTAMLWPPLGRVLGTAPVSAAILWFCAAAVVATIVVTEVTKHGVAVWQRRYRR